MPRAIAVPVIFVLTLGDPDVCNFRPHLYPSLPLCLLVANFPNF